MSGVGRLAPSRIAVIPGDGIGVEVAESARGVLAAVVEAHGLNLDLTFLD